MNNDGIGMEESKDLYKALDIDEAREQEATGKMSAEREAFLKQVIAPKMHQFVMAGDQGKVASLSNIRDEVVKGNISTEEAKTEIDKLGTVQSL